MGAIRKDRVPTDFFGPSCYRRNQKEKWIDPHGYRKLKNIPRTLYTAPPICSDTSNGLPIPLELSIFPHTNTPIITNNVVTGHLGHGGENMALDQRRVPLYLANSVRNERFAAVIIPQDAATVLFFSNGKIVITGKTTPESALFALHLYRQKLGKVLQPVILCDDPN